MPEALVRCATIAVTGTGPPLSATVARTTRGGRSCSGSVAPQNGSRNVSAAPACVTCPTRHAGGANEHADVEPGVIVALDQVGLVARIGLAGGDRVGVDARRQRLQHLERLDLLHREQVRRLEDRTNLPRQLGQAHRQGRAVHDDIVVVRRVDRIEQPIGVQAWRS